MIKQRKAKSGVMRSVRTVTVLLLCLAVFSACTMDEIHYLNNSAEETESDDFMERIWRQEQANPFGGDVKMSPERLAHEITQAINVPEHMDRIFNALPSNRRPQIDAELFRRYVEALRPPNGEKILGFEELAEDEIQNFQAQILANRPDLTDEVLASRYFRLEFRPASSTRRIDREVKSLILAIQIREESAYLSRAWIESIVKIHDYALLYFDALSNDVLDKNDIRSIAWLFREAEPAFQGERQDEYSFAKARLTGQYYESTVTTEPRSSSCRYLLPGVAAYEQEYRYGSELSGIRTVKFTEKRGVLSVEEPIPSEQSKEDQEIRLYGKTLFPRKILTGGGIYSSEDLHPLVGPILEMSEFNEPETPGADAAQNTQVRKYEIRYYGLRLIVQGRIDEKAKIWHGKVMAVILESRICSLGKSIRPGMTEASFHFYYPFHRENGGLLKGNGDPFSKMILTYTAADGKIESFTLRESN